MTVEVSGAQTINESVAPLRGLIVACGPAASYMAAAAVNGFRVTTAGLQALVAKAAQAGTLDTGGQNFVRGPEWDLSEYGIKSAVTTPGNEAELQRTLDTALYQNKPIVLGLSNANQLTSEPPHLFGHFITIFGKTNAGEYLTGDPNTVAASEGHFTTNSLGQLWDSDVQSMTIPDQSATGLPGGGNFGVDFSIGFPQSVYDGIGSAVGSGIASGLTTAEKAIMQDISIQIGGIWNALLRLGVAGLGLGIFVISLDKFLGSFDTSNIAGKPGPGEQFIRNRIQNVKDVSKEATEAATLAVGS
jgi:hypothetical protein